MGKKKSKAGTKHVKKMKVKARQVLSDLFVLANLAGYSPVGSSPLSRLKLETDPSAVARREEQLREQERRSSNRWPDERKQRLDAAQRAQNVRSTVLLHRSG